MVKRLIKIINIFFHPFNYLRLKKYRRNFGFCDPTASIDLPLECACPSKVFLYENTVLKPGTIIMISPKSKEGRFILKKNSGASHGLTVITGNHAVNPIIGKWGMDQLKRHNGDIDKDIIVEEDVWIGANVTLLSGVNIGRGSLIGAGAVVRDNVPPYSIVIGNPSCIIGFRLTPEEIVEHEKILYPLNERLDRNLLENNYEKFFIKRISKIKEYLH